MKCQTLLGGGGSSYRKVLWCGLDAAYALGLAVALGPVDQLRGTADPLVRCSVVAVGRGLVAALDRRARPPTVVEEAGGSP